MKIIITLIILIFMAFPVFSGGRYLLVNEQRIELNNPVSLEINYRSDEIVIKKSDSNLLIIEEYMNRDDSSYYANISQTDNIISINRGERPFYPGLFGSFNVLVEIHIPENLIDSISIATSSGRIVLADDFAISAISLTTSSGSIRSANLTGNVYSATSSGSINLGNITGNVSANSSSGRIVIDLVRGSLNAGTSSGSVNVSVINGSVNVRTSSGRINCSILEFSNDITLISSSGRIELILPNNSNFNFTARRTSGRLTTPFSDRLSSPVSDRRLAEGVIGESSPDKNINIRTTSGSISVQWRE